ncbi:MAG: hypothetical protein JOZ43_00410, partial [Acidobacteriales bacterium]|nr:hypothetical protein [Terriglobales bacterium]
MKTARYWLLAGVMPLATALEFGQTGSLPAAPTPQVGSSQAQAPAPSNPPEQKPPDAPAFQDIAPRKKLAPPQQQQSAEPVKTPDEQQS